MRKFREWIPGKRAGGIIADGADFHSIRWAAEKPQLLLCPERVISGVESPLFHFFSAVRTLHQKAHPFGKAKNALPLLQETKRLQTLCGTTLAAVPSRGAAPQCPLSRADAVTGIDRRAAPQCPLSRADAVTGIDRPCLLASSFSRRLQGDFHHPPLAASHQTAALLAGIERLLVLFHAGMFSLPNHRITFLRFVKAVFIKIPVQPALLWAGTRSQPSQRP